MDFYTVLDHIIDLLRHRRKVSYKALQRQFSLDDDCLAALKEELLYAYPQVVDDDGRGLVWTGEAPPPETNVWRGVALGVSDIVTLVTARLQQEKRLTYAALKHIFGLDDATLDVVRQELIFAKRVAADEHGRVLVWTREPSLDFSTTGPNALTQPCPAVPHLPRRRPDTSYGRGHTRGSGQGLTPYPCPARFYSRSRTAASNSAVLRPGGLDAFVPTARCRRVPRRGARLSGPP